jgi:rhodanese-related sulfurtransferase
MSLAPGTRRKLEQGFCLKNVLLETLLVGAAGAMFAFATNALSPQGLNLARDYFPGATRAHAQAPTGINATAASAGTNAAPLSEAELLAARLQAKGIHLAEKNQVTELSRDPRREQDLVLFIDARDDKDYAAGHIPGAYQLDYYHPEKFMASIVPLCLNAQQIVVYCHGGDCVDSELTATLLKETGIPVEKLFVYGGGFNEWEKSGLPMELGLRKSGNMRAAVAR